VSILRTRRERFPWFPTMNCQVCLRDLECLNFCPADVFDWDRATGRPVVARPFDCIPGCRSCAENCKAKCISLPGKKEVAAALKRIRAEDGLSIPRADGKGRARAMPRGSNRHRARGDKWKPRNPGNRSAITLTPRGNKVAE
jgi:NAD-dependent dihydropyrimidine dehydrogenase PreA subunit